MPRHRRRTRRGQVGIDLIELNRAPVYGDWIGWIADVGEPVQRWAWLGRLEFGEDERELGDVTVR